MLVLHSTKGGGAWGMGDGRCTIFGLWIVDLEMDGGGDVGKQQEGMNRPGWVGRGSWLVG